ncbi:MAG: acyl-CoA dehydrogenase family protein [Anaerolineae bacterium]
MNFDLTPEQQRLKQEIIRFARKELNDGIIERDRTHQFPHDLWLKCGEMGFQGLPIPEAYGGSGLDSLTTAVALEALGYACEDSGLVFSIGAHLLACVVPIWKHGTEAQKEKYLPPLCKGSLIAVNAITEPDSGSDVFAMTTRAKKVEGGWQLNGRKMFASNGPVADVALVYAVTDREKGYQGGITAFLVEKGTPGFTQGQTFEKMGLRTSPIGELVFEDAVVGETAVLGHVGAGAIQFSQSMNWERVCLFASHVGTMTRLLEKAVAYARTRQQGGQPIGKYQAVAHRIADMKVQVEAARLLIYKAAWQLERSRAVSLDAAIAKLFTSEAYVAASRGAVQIFGGYGFMTEYEVERSLRDAVGSTIYSGSSEIQRNIIARWLGL